MEAGRCRSANRWQSKKSDAEEDEEMAGAKRRKDVAGVAADRRSGLVIGCNRKLTLKNRRKPDSWRLFLYEQKLKEKRCAHEQWTVECGW